MSTPKAGSPKTTAKSAVRPMRSPTKSTVRSVWPTAKSSSKSTTLWPIQLKSAAKSTPVRSVWAPTESTVRPIWSPAESATEPASMTVPVTVSVVTTVTAEQPIDQVLARVDDLAEVEPGVDGGATPGGARVVSGASSGGCIKLLPCCPPGEGDRTRHQK